eukprot:scaffold33832_cov33-Phaeocystis_antarctica.AAC.1
MLVRVRVRVRVGVREAAVVLERGGHGVSNDVPTHRIAHQHHRTQLIVLDALRLHLQLRCPHGLYDIMQSAISWGFCSCYHFITPVLSSWLRPPS